MKFWRNGIDKRRPKYSEKECPYATFISANPTDIFLGLNLDLFGSRYTTN
jgi:hypothetical protein